jgi:hypothetical protein
MNIYARNTVNNSSLTDPSSSLVVDPSATTDLLKEKSKTDTSDIIPNNNSHNVTNDDTHNDISNVTENGNNTISDIELTTNITSSTPSSLLVTNHTSLTPSIIQQPTHSPYTIPIPSTTPIPSSILSSIPTSIPTSVSYSTTTLKPSFPTSITNVQTAMLKPSYASRVDHKGFTIRRILGPLMIIGLYFLWKRLIRHGNLRYEKKKIIKKIRKDLKAEAKAINKQRIADEEEAYNQYDFNYEDVHIGMHIEIVDF